MISGGSRSFAKRERQALFQSRKFQKMGMACIVYGEISEGSGQMLPPLDPPLMSLWTNNSILNAIPNLQIKTYNPINLIIVDNWDKKEHLTD